MYALKGLGYPLCKRNSTAQRVDQKWISDSKQVRSCKGLPQRHERPQQVTNRAHSTQPAYYSWEEARASTLSPQLL